MVEDPRGVPIAAAGPATVARLEAALDDILSLSGDPVARLDSVLTEEPDCVLARLARASLFAWSLHPRLVAAARAELGEAESRLERAGERERGLAAAVRAWLDADRARACACFDELLERFPADLLALFFAHQADFFAGHSEALHRRPERALSHIAPDMPGHGYVLGMRAFGEEEAGEFELARELGLAAVARNRRDVWAIHAVAHVFEETGRDEEGIRWYTEREADWAENSYFACHNAWHLALYHLDREDVPAALATYDRHLRPHRRAILLNLCDAASFLWRLQLAGHGAAERISELAAAFDAKYEIGLHPFTDVHAFMVFALADDRRRLDELRDGLARIAESTNARAGSIREAVLPVGEAFAAFAEGRPERTVALLESLGERVQAITGSHAQRDVVELTLIEAAIRSQHHSLARRLLDARLTRRPGSRRTWRDLRRLCIS